MAPREGDPYEAIKSTHDFREIPKHEWSHVNAGQIVERIMKSRGLYEERQRRKGAKTELEVELEAKEKGLEDVE